MKFTDDLLPAIIYLGILTGYIIILHLFRIFYRIKIRRSHFTENFLRAPGQSLLKKIDGLNEDITLIVTTLVTIPLVFYSGYVSHLYFYKREFDPIVVNIIGGLGAVVTIYCLVKTLKLLKKRRMIRFGYEGQITVGQELNQLMLEGHYVYHDFPAEKFNIDHIVVGRSGIFAVETKAQSKPTTKNRRQDATVEYNGKMLDFPDGDDFKIIEQAEQQAFWLSEWISSAIGEQVAARAIVALPGWFVKRTSADGISVVNPQQFPSLFKHIKPRTLNDEMISRIVHQLEQKCRDIAPGSKASDGGQPAIKDPVGINSTGVDTHHNNPRLLKIYDFSPN